jgi:hypothetical protein
LFGGQQLRHIYFCVAIGAPVIFPKIVDDDISLLFVFSKCRREGRFIVFRDVGAVDFAIHTPRDRANKSATDLPTGAVSRVVSVQKT